MRRVIDAICPARMGTGFRWLLASSWVSNIGDGIGFAAGPLLVASQTNDPILVALAALLQRLPWLLFGLQAGVIADRVDRRRIVITVNLARAAVLGVLTATIATDTVNVVLILATMFMLGTAETFADITSGTLLPMVVDKADLGVANARLEVGFITVNQLVGPPVGAMLFAIGMAFPFAIQAICVALAAPLVARISLTQLPESATRSRMRVEIMEGVRWLWNHASVRTLTLTVVSFNVTFGAAISVLVLYSYERLGLSELGFGLLTTVGAVGGILGTSAYGWLERRVGVANLMRTGLIVETLTHLTLASTRLPVVAFAVFFVFGIHESVWGTTVMTVRQRAVPNEFQGRVGSVYMIGLQGGLVIGAAFGGVIASVWGVTGPFWFAFVGSTLILLAIWRQLANIAHAD
jgi:MFS family permease